MTRVIGAWCANPKFSKGARALEIPLEGGENDFSSLVRGVSQDVNPATVLFELERLRLVERSGDRLRLLWNSYQISGDIDDAYLLLQRDIHALVEGVDSNIRQTSSAPNLHISTQFDNVSVEAAPRIREWLLQRGAAFHAEARDFIGSFDKDINPARYAEPGGVRVTVGSFSLCQNGEGVDD
jgi:hypothetical protein